jgi:chaperonin GroES
MGMSLDKLLSYIGKKNIAEDLQDDKLARIGLDVIETAARDLATMEDWKKYVDHGIELCRQEFQPNNESMPNGANFKTDILTSAANAFGNKAIVELMRDPNLAKTNIIGSDTIKNVIERKMSEAQRMKGELEPITAQLEQMKQEGIEVGDLEEVAKQLSEDIAKTEAEVKTKKQELRIRSERADRVAVLMNWQINHEVPNWREDMEAMMYSLPLVGTLFRKSYYDPTIGCNSSITIKYPDYIVNQQTESMEKCLSFIHIMNFSKSEYEARVSAGIWSEIDIYTKDDKGDAGSNEAEGADSSDDNCNKFYEQYGWLDLDEDGVDEPYIITVHVATQKVVRIAARFAEDTIYTSFEDGRPMPFLKAQRARIEKIKADATELNVTPEFPDPKDTTGYEVVRVMPRGVITKYGLIPSFDGTFLDIGFYHILGATVMGVNKTANDLLNAGTLYNQNGGVISSDFKLKGNGEITIGNGRFNQSELKAAQLQGSMIQWPFKEPSQVLFALNEKLEGQARTFSNSIDAGGQIQANTAPTTALALIQESLVQHSAHMARIIRSIGKEISILFELTKDYFSQEDYVKVTGDDDASIEQDFDIDGLAITCGANPEMSSRMQRMILAQAELEQVPLVTQAGGNPIPIIKNYFKRIGTENLDEIFPNEAEMSPEEKAQMQQMQQMQQQANQMAEAQLKLTQLQTELLQRGEDRKDQEAMVKIQETLAKITGLLEDARNTRADTILKQEQAETEHTKNKLSIYTAASNELDKAEAALGAPDAIVE